jgi:hypothetical protein
LSALRGEIGFTYDKRRWKLTLKEEVKPELDEELERVMKA